MWTLPLLIVGLTISLALPLGSYMAVIYDGRCRIPAWLRWFEGRLDTGPQDWKQYIFSLLYFNVGIFFTGFAILALQPFLPLNPDGKKMLAPTTIFNTVCSFLSNTNLQHYSGEVHLSYFSQLFFICWKQFITPSIGLCALVAIIRGLRGDKLMGNFYVDMWRSVVYVFPASGLRGCRLVDGGRFANDAGGECAKVATVEAGAMGTEENGAAKPQEIERGPVAAIVAFKQLGTNGGGFFGAQRRPSIRESKQLYQPSDLPVHHPDSRRVALHVWSHAEPDAACDGDLQCHAGIEFDHDRMGSPLRRRVPKRGIIVTAGTDVPDCRFQCRRGSSHHHSAVRRQPAGG